MTDPALGREIGSYQIVDLLGHGGMGKVYRAQHPYIGKQVAIKLLKADVSDQADAVQRFFQEARAVNNIHHENVIDVLDFGRTPEGEYFILMELLEGRTLSHALKNEAPFAAKRVGHIGLQICSALSAAHEKNIIHRDLKSDNIFLIKRAGQKDFVKVLDFGIAKLLDDPTGNAHTTTGMVMGTPLYMAPEQALGRPLDAQTDVYALGVILYQMATGTVPFFDPNPVALATMHVTAKVPKPSERHSSVDPKLEKIILRCLEKEKAERFPSMRDVASELAAACHLDTAPYFGLDPNSGWQPKLEVDKTIKTPAASAKESGATPAADTAPTRASTTSLPRPSRSRAGALAAVVSGLLALGVVAVALGPSFFEKEEPKAPSAPLPPQKAALPPAPVSAPAPVVAPQSQAAPAPLQAAAPEPAPTGKPKPIKPQNTTKPKSDPSKQNPPAPAPPKQEPPQPPPRLENGVIDVFK